MRYSNNWHSFNRLVKTIDVGYVTRTNNLYKKSYGVVVRCNGKILMLEKTWSYAYNSVISGDYNNVSLFQFLHEMKKSEINHLLSSDFVLPNARPAQKDRFINLKSIISELCTIISDGEHDEYHELVFPSGEQHQNESPEQTALRELKEETGLKLNADMLHPEVITTISSNGDVYQTIVYVVDIDEIPDRIILSTEFITYHWIDRDNTHLIRSPQIRSLVERLI